MKNDVLFGILLSLINENKVTAKKLAAKYEVTPRTIYRYIDTLDMAGVPIMTTKGKNGGLSIMDSFKLNKTYFTKEEYEHIITALQNFSHSFPMPVSETVINKFRALEKANQSEKEFMLKSSSLIIDGGPWTDATEYRNKLTAINQALTNRNVLRVTYINNRHEKTQRDIEPHTIVLKEGFWYVYAYCLMRKEFRLFKIARIVALSVLDKTFKRREIDEQNAPWNKGFDNPDQAINIELEFEPSVQADLEEWLGVKAIVGNKAFATVPDTPSLVRKLLSFGSDIKVIFPTTLRDKVLEEAKLIGAKYKNK